MTFALSSSGSRNGVVKSAVDELGSATEAVLIRILGLRVSSQSESAQEQLAQKELSRRRPQTIEPLARTL
jgi:hypothetical protein